MTKSEASPALRDGACTVNVKGVPKLIKAGPKQRKARMFLFDHGKMGSIPFFLMISISFLENAKATKAFAVPTGLPCVTKENS